MAQLAIKGHATRGKEVIEILEMLGGKKIGYSGHSGFGSPYYYYIDEWNNIVGTTELSNNKAFVTYTLAEFLEKFPYKVGDKVIDIKTDRIAEIYKAHWSVSNNCTYYDVKFRNNTGCVRNYKFLQPYKEETMDEVNKVVFDVNAQCCDMMNNLIKKETMESKPNLLQQLKDYFDNTPRDVLEKEWHEYDKYNEIGPTVNEYLEYVNKSRQPKYPKNYEECYELTVQWKEYDCNPNSELILCEAPIHDFCKLIVARNIYWKIAGDEMGLEKPWKPDWSIYEHKFCLGTDKDKVIEECVTTGNRILAFPTEEMRGAFYENFKDLINETKELL